MKTYQALTAIALSALALPALAQLTPVGTWKSVDEKTGQPKSEIVIEDQGGVQAVSARRSGIEPVLAQAGEAGLGDHAENGLLGIGQLHG